MLPKKEIPKEKSSLHPRNKHRKHYDFVELCKSCPELMQFVKRNEYNDESIDFFNPEAVKTLNKALLKCYYGISHWSIPQHYLCPPIPGRADYIHHIADVVGSYYKNNIPTGNTFKCLDIGTGANCVYPIIGNKEYGWSFTGTDIDPIALENASQIIRHNPSLMTKINLRLQQDPGSIFKGIIQKDEYFDLSICNPPFHASKEEAKASAIRKLSNLKGKKITTPTLNFGGKNNELWCAGGEERFVRDMIRESKQFATSCFLFSTLISKESSLVSVYKTLKESAARDVKTIPMGQGNKKGRIVVWTFLSADQQRR